MVLSTTDIHSANVFCFRDRSYCLVNLILVLEIDL